jgi:anti-anti-sigma regulatory factor
MSDTTDEVRVSHYDGNGTWLIEFSGEHDIATSPLVDARTLGLWPSCSVAIVDLRSVTFIDSSIVNWLTRTRRTLESNGAGNAVRIVEDPRSNALHPVFDALGIRDEFACYTTVQDAVANAPARRVVHRRASREVRPHLADREIRNSGGHVAPGDMRLA